VTAKSLNHLSTHAPQILVGDKEKFLKSSAEKFQKQRNSHGSRSNIKSTYRSFCLALPSWKFKADYLRKSLVGGWLLPTRLEFYLCQQASSHCFATIRGTLGSEREAKLTSKWDKSISKSNIHHWKRDPIFMIFDIRLKIVEYFTRANQRIAAYMRVKCGILLPDASCYLHLRWNPILFAVMYERSGKTCGAAEVRSFELNR
jgi:hypothetical protein